MFTLYLLLVIATVLYFLLKNIYSYWERKGFPYIKPSIPFGNLDSVRRGEKSFGSAIYDLYVNTKEPFIGIYLLFRPALLIRDAELAKSILTKDFQSFHDRGTYNDESDQMSMNLFSLPGNKWKTLRSKLTPAFSSGKLKSMFETVENVAMRMTDYLNTIAPKEKDKTVKVDIRDLTSKYAVDIISNLIFGLDVDSFKEPKNAFRVATARVTELSITAIARMIGLFVCPGIYKFLPFFKATDPYVKDFMIDIVNKTIDHREKESVSRKDFMQLLIQLRNTGKINLDDGIWSVESAAENLKSMSIEMCASQAFLFYIAGSETTSFAITYCLHELTQNPDVMKKALKEIDEVLAKHNGKITYDAIQDMKYLDLCVMETIRKYPGLPILNRECTENFTLPGTKYTVEKGTPIIISLLGIHRDPDYFPEPLKFIPERYIEKNYTEAAYLPFGEGPRACIGLRMGKVNTKAALAMLLKNFEFKATEKREIEFDIVSTGVHPKGGIHLLVSRR